jgi:hypothetical protein
MLVFGKSRRHLFGLQAPAGLYLSFAQILRHHLCELTARALAPPVNLFATLLFHSFEGQQAPEQLPRYVDLFRHNKLLYGGYYTT